MATTARRVVRRPSSDSKWYLGLDASLTGYGVALYQPDTDVCDFTLIKTKPPKPQDPPGLRFREIADRLQDAWHGREVDLVCMERAAYAASGAYTGGLVHAVTALALLDAFGHQPAARPALVATGTLKKFATGNGAAKKQSMLLGVYKKWGFETDDDNLADAYALARLAAALRSGSEVKYEAECIKTVLGNWQP